MRLLALILASAVVGTVLGTALAVYDLRYAREIVVPQSAGLAAAPTTDDRPAPRIEVPAPEFEFGKMQRGTHNSHEFVVKNVGDAPLLIQVGNTTCRCTLGVASDEPILPGRSSTVRLEWHANADPGPFEQTATLITNDPQQTRFDLTIKGQVIKAEGIEPPDFMFDKVAAGEAKSASVFIMAMFEDEITVSDAEFTNPDNREFFDVRTEAVARDQLPNPAAKAGVRVTVTIKPGLPLGRIGQRLAVRTSLKDAPELQIPFLGRVVGDISVSGLEWDDERSLLNLGRVKSAEGKRTKLNIIIRGSESASVKLNVTSHEPPALRTTISQPVRYNDSLVHVPVEIEVPPGTPPMIHLGTAQNDEGQIVLGTTHHSVRQVVIPVRFMVEE